MKMISYIAVTMSGAFLMFVLTFSSFNAIRSTRAIDTAEVTKVYTEIISLRDESSVMLNNVKENNVNRR
jgi:hypothetical protein